MYTNTLIQQSYVQVVTHPMIPYTWKFSRDLYFVEGLKGFCGKFFEFNTLFPCFLRIKISCTGKLTAKSTNVMSLKNFCVHYTVSKILTCPVRIYSRVVAAGSLVTTIIIKLHSAICTCYVIHTISLSTVVLNSRDRHEKHGVPLLHASITHLTIYFT